MELALSGSLLRTFFKSVACLAKIGSEILIEATAGGEPGSGVRDGVRHPADHLPTHNLFGGCPVFKVSLGVACI